MQDVCGSGAVDKGRFCVVCEGVEIQMMKWRYVILRMVVLIAASLFLFNLGWRDGRRSVVIPPCPEQHWEFGIPTVTELQVYLETTPDGVMGKKTLAKWQEYVDNKRAAKWFDPNSY